MPNTRARYRVTSSSNASLSPAWHRFTKSNSDTSDCARVASVCMIGRSAPLFHSTLKTVRAETTAPLSAIFTHQAYDAVADFEESLLQHQIFRSADQSGGLSQLGRCVHRGRDRLQGSFQIRDRHPDFVEMITAQRCCQLCTGQSRMSSELNGCGLVLERSVLIEQLVDPKREIESSPIKIVLLEGFARGRGIVRIGLFVFAGGFIEKCVHLRAPVFLIQ